MTKRKVRVVTGTRAKYGLLYWLMKEIENDPELELKKYNQQYPKKEIKKFDLSHDRFLLVDEKEVYHFGASLKDLGKKWFAVSKEYTAILERSFIKVGSVTK